MAYRKSQNNSCCKFLNISCDCLNVWMNASQLPGPPLGPVGPSPPVGPAAPDGPTAPVSPGPPVGPVGPIKSFEKNTTLTGIPERLSKRHNVRAYDIICKC